MIFPFGKVIYGLFRYTKNGRILISQSFWDFDLFFWFWDSGREKDKALLLESAPRFEKSTMTAWSLFFGLGKPQIRNPIDKSAPTLLFLNFFIFFQIFAEGKVVDVGDFCRFVSNCRESCFVLLALSAAEISTFSNFLAGNFARSSKFGHLNFVVIWIVLFALSLVNSLGG